MASIGGGNFLCDACWKIFSDGSYEFWAAWDEEHPQDWLWGPKPLASWHHTSWEEFLHAVAAGCWICKHILQAWKQDGEIDGRVVSDSDFATFHYRLEGSPLE